MKWALLASAFAATFAAASPVLVTRDEFGLEWIGNDTSLPKVV